ncbi:hypothetical protein PI124_g4107 [Phytophthora idaei]|nr:hypothetical protein PI125_g2727 [Phytophthora idaei]KAG3166045.1 hypothetical protein PI126_g4377 [Phytophthora idaei]KAG3251290.1 hypothetical protein PI124_g4107 [Phytophthora idaei]
MPSASTTDAHAFSGQGVPAADTSMFQQLFAMMAQQNQTFKSAIQAQMQQTQMQIAQAQFEQLMLQQGGRNRKKEPPSYEGKIDEDLELWIFATEEHYASNRALMIADSSDFVTMVSSNLGTTVLNWYRTFSAQRETKGDTRLGHCSSIICGRASDLVILSTIYESAFSS